MEEKDKDALQHDENVIPTPEKAQKEATEEVDADTKEGEVKEQNNDEITSAETIEEETIAESPVEEALVETQTEPVAAEIAEEVPAHTIEEEGQETIDVVADSEPIDEETTAETPMEVAEEIAPLETPAEAVEAENTEEVPADSDEVQSDEHEEDDEYEADSKEMADYSTMTMTALLAEAEKLLATREAKDIKDEMEGIHGVAMAHFEEERSEKLHAFIEEGGIEMDFHYEQPVKRKILEVYKSYKSKRHAFYKQLEQDLSANLDVKKGIIDAIKELPNTEGNVPDKYKQFREFQDRWKATGPVPRTESDELWKNYHHHVDNFYDFLHISNELRDLDFKKNLEAKTLLCEEAEALSALESNAETFKTLQGLHKKWKISGPVDREHREPIWERFSEASKIIHDKRHAYYESLRASREELLEQKRQIIEKMKSLELESLKSHSMWQNAIKVANDLRDAFKNVGRIALPENDVLWEEFRGLNRDFNKGKNEFYKFLKSAHQENLDKKRALLAQAQALRESEDWREASNELKRIQSNWKKIGYVPKVESDKIWKEFREACNYFFNRLTKYNKQVDKEFEGNLATKKEILERLTNWKAGDSKSAGMKELKAFIVEWKAAGRVPRTAKDIDNDFNKILDEHFTTLKLNQKEASLIRFENKVHNLVEGENNRLLDREEEQLQRKIDEGQKDLAQLENNILFFANANQNSPIVKEAHRQIDSQKEQIELLKSKMKMLRKMANEG